MILWITLTLMIALAVSVLTIPLVRRYDLQKGRSTTLEVLKTQLGEIDAQLVGGVVSDAEAEGLKTEIKRRILAETDRAEATARPLDARALPVVALGIVVVVALTATGLYATIGRPELSTAANRAPAPGLDNTSAATQAAGSDHPMGDVGRMIAGLEAKIQQSPNDPEDWRMLGWSYMNTGRPADAATAYGRAAALSPGNAEYLSAEGEAMVQSAGGITSPEAAAIFRRAMVADPGDPRARYYLDIFKDQQGDHTGAMSDWIALLKSAPAGAPWVPEVRSYVENVARERGLDIAGKLPPAPQAAPAPGASAAPPSSTAPGPTEAQIAAAGQMSDSDRQAMIQSMVDKLAAQLKQNPRDSDGWMRLMKVRMVLGEKKEAAAAYIDARKAFFDTPSEQAALRDAAHTLGIPGA